MNVLERDFFTDREILRNPLSYYRAPHECGPVWREPHQGVFMLSRIDQILEVYTDHERFSAIVGPLGPQVNLPKPAQGESWGDVIERHRHEMPWATNAWLSIHRSTLGIGRWRASSSRRSVPYSVFYLEKLGRLWVAAVAAARRVLSHNGVPFPLIRRPYRANWVAFLRRFVV